MVYEGSTPVVEKPRSAFSSWSFYQKQSPSFETSTPWCKLLSQSGQVFRAYLTNVELEPVL